LTTQRSATNAKVGVQVVTVSGNYPDTGFREFPGSEPLSAVLDQARAHLKLHITDQWMAKLDGRTLDASLALIANGISGNVQIMWGQDESGGGSPTDASASI
jgi:hypothetical protein